MSVLTTDDLILDPERYATVRGERRAEAIRLRRSRRVQLGELVALEFENADTLRYQVQEMLFVERVREPNAAEAELATYQRLLPTATTLSATMLIEIPQQDQVRDQLARLTGVHNSIRLEVGEEHCPAFDVPPPDEAPGNQTFSVHFLRFELSEAAITAMAGDAAARVVVDHPEYQAATDLPEQTRRQLVADLSAAAG